MCFADIKIPKKEKEPQDQQYFQIDDKNRNISKIHDSGQPLLQQEDTKTGGIDTAKETS